MGVGAHGKVQICNPLVFIILQFCGDLDESMHQSGPGSGHANARVRKDGWGLGVMGEMGYGYSTNHWLVL